MIILGLDPGLGTMGYGVIEKDKNGNCSAVDYGVVRTPAGENLAVRLCILEEGVNALFDKFRPEEAAMEELFFSTNITTGISVAQGRGVILLACFHAGVPLYEYTPLQVKQAVVGYGRAEKRQVIDMVRRILNMKSAPKPDDAADAVAIALCHARSATSLIGRQTEVNKCTTI